MGQSAFNYIATGILGLSENSLKVYYDFNSGNTGHLLSVPIGNFENSGQILGNSGQFFGDMGSGNFAEASIKIQESTGLFSKSATFIITQERTGTQNGTIFSCLEGNAFKSGYSFGINDANKWYFEYFNDPYPSIKTSLKNMGDKNAWAVKLEDNSVSFSYFNNNTCQLEKENWGIDSNKLLPSDQWYIGTGKNQPKYNHYLDNFIYFNTALSDSTLTRLFSGIWNDGAGTVSGSFPYATGQITGYSLVTTGVTGILNESQEFSGNFTSSVQRDIYQYEILTGVIAQNEEYLEFLGNIPQYCTNREETPIYFKGIQEIAGTGITGYNLVFSGTDSVEQSIPVYTTVFETGLTSSGTINAPLYNTGDPNDIIYVGRFDMTGDLDYLNSLGMNSVKYLGISQTGYLEGFVMSGAPFKDYFNKIANYNFANLSFTLPQPYNPNYTDVFANGLLKLNTGYNSTGEFFNQGTFISGDYYISGRNLIFKKNYGATGKIIYDILNSGDRFDTGIREFIYYDGELVLYSGDAIYLNDQINYSSSGTLSYNISDKMFFADGKKLISGVDYTGVNDLFSPNSGISGSIGELKILSFRKFQFPLTNYERSNLINLSIPTGFLSGTTGSNAPFELISGIYDGNPTTIDYFNGNSGQYILDSGVYPTGFYRNKTGVIEYPIYTGWQIYSGVDVYDIRIGLEPAPPTNGWENGTEFYLLYDSGNLNFPITGEKFLRDTSINWLNGVRIDRTKFLEHSLHSDLIKDGNVLFNGATGFFQNNTDFWA